MDLEVVESRSIGIGLCLVTIGVVAVVVATDLNNGGFVQAKEEVPYSANWTKTPALDDESKREVQRWFAERAKQNDYPTETQIESKLQDEHVITFLRHNPHLREGYCKPLKKETLNGVRRKLKVKGLKTENKTERRMVRILDPQGTRPPNHRVPSQGRVGRGALCIVGEWRTFSMPAVHEGVELALHVWQADVFMFYHTRYDAVAMAYKNRQNAVACAEETHLLQNFTHVEHLPFDGSGCKSKATIQIRQINRCFRHVLEHERRTGVRYEYFIRSRPDYIVWKPESIQPNLTHMLAVRPKPDMLFAIPRAKLHEWLTRMNETKCSKHCCLEYTHGMLKAKNHRIWKQQGAIARGWEHMEYASNPRPVIPPSFLHCNITGRPVEQP